MEKYGERYQLENIVSAVHPLGAGLRGAIPTIIGWVAAGSPSQYFPVDRKQSNSKNPFTRRSPFPLVSGRSQRGSFASECERFRANDE